MECQDLINESQNVQLIVQFMGMQAMVHTLQEKEKPKQTKWVILFSSGKAFDCARPCDNKEEAGDRKKE